MDLIPQAQIQKGTLLIASPEIESGLFYRAVMLVCEHNPASSFGILVNKELDMELPEEVLDISEIANQHVGMRAGGPVQTNQLMLLHTSDNSEIQTMKICDGVYLGGDLQFLQDSLSDPEGPAILLCFGYAGWTGGQLEREFLDGSWFMMPASKRYLFEVPPEKLWRQILLDMDGRYATLSSIPDDLSVN